eukprot:461593-Rhodomonas_salina.1
MQPPTRQGIPTGLSLGGWQNSRYSPITDYPGTASSATATVAFIPGYDSPNSTVLLVLLGVVTEQ